MLEKLTPEQEARLPEIADEWIKIGTCTEPADFEAAAALLPDVYRAADLKPPKHVYHTSSPITGALWAAVLTLEYGVKRHSVETPIALQGAKEGDIKPFWEQVKKEIAEQAPEIKIPSFKKVQSLIGVTLSDQVGGAEDAGWLSFYSAFLEFGVDECRKLLPLMQLAKVCGRWASYEEVAILQDRPMLWTRNGEGKVESAAEPAIQWRDGWCEHRLRGTKLPFWAFSELSAERIERVENQETKRILMEEYGMDRWLDAIKAEPVQEDRYGKLFRIEGHLFPLVRVTNSSPEPDGTYKDYVLTATRQDCKTAHDAVASTFGLTAKTYNPHVET